MQRFFPAGTLERLQVSQIAIFAFGILAVGGCSKSEVQVMTPPPPLPPLTTPAPLAMPVRKTAADRLVEIDRLLAAPLTGLPEESDQRFVLRAEREALIASGQTPYRMRTQSVAGRDLSIQPNAPTTTQRLANGDVVNYATPTSQNGRIIVAPDSQASNLSYLEQMTPTERERYYKVLRLQNRRRVDVDVYNHR
jgi:hypothetical protein